MPERLKPPFIYYGGKVTLAPKIAAVLPPHDHYVEPFAGSLAVLLAKTPTRFETVNDLDQRLVTFWRVLRERPEELVRVCQATPHSRAEHVAAFDLPPEGDELEVARRVWVCLSQGRGGTLKRTGWRFYRDPAGTRVSMPQYLDAYRERLEALAERLSAVSLECRDGLEVLQDYGQVPTACLYLDPPYLGSTRSSRQYVQELATREEHERLAAAAADCRAAVVISGYSSDLYDELYAGWHRHEFRAWTGNAPEGKGDRVEVLWSNRRLGEDTLWD